MQWNAFKSFTLSSKPPLESFTIACQLVSHRTIVTYLGVSISTQGVTHHRLLERFTQAHWTAYKHIHGLKPARLAYVQRRTLAQTFIVSLVTYVLYTQPWTSEVEEQAQKLEKLFMGLILRVRTQGIYRFRVGRTLLNFPLFSTLREVRAVKLLTKLRVVASTQPSINARDRAEVLQKLPPLRTLQRQRGEQ